MSEHNESFDDFFGEVDSSIPTPEELEDSEASYTDGGKPSEVIYRSQSIDICGLIKRLDDGKIVVPSFSSNTNNDGIESENFQRGYVWSKNQADRFIESVLLSYPIPGIFLVDQGSNEAGEKISKKLVLDGQQRLTTLRDFRNGTGHFTDKGLKNVSDALDFKDMKYDDLSEGLKELFDDTPIQTTIIRAKSDVEGYQVIYQIFERINTGGTKLLPHEIRIATYAGKAVNFIQSLNEYKNWRILYNDKEELDTVKHQRDHELVLRILAFYFNNRLKYNHGNALVKYSFKKPLKQFLNTFMDILQNPQEEIQEEVLKASEYFKQACDILLEYQNNKEIKHILTLSDKSRTVSPGWTETIFYGTMSYIAKNTKTKVTLEKIAPYIDELVKEKGKAKFYNAASRSAGDPTSVKIRFEAAKKAFHI